VNLLSLTKFLDTDADTTASLFLEHLKEKSNPYSGMACSLTDNQTEYRNSSNWNRYNNLWFVCRWQSVS